VGNGRELDSRCLLGLVGEMTPVGDEFAKFVANAVAETLLVYFAATVLRGAM